MLKNVRPAGADSLFDDGDVADHLPPRLRRLERRGGRGAIGEKGLKGQEGRKGHERGNRRDDGDEGRETRDAARRAVGLRAVGGDHLDRPDALRPRRVSNTSSRERVIADNVSKNVPH